jgi:mRNA interferase YafQ
MFDLHRSNKFRKSFKRVSGSGNFDAVTFERIVSFLVNRQTLPHVYRDHALKGKSSSLRECHIKGDCLLIYKIDESDNIIFLVDIGNHANLFE